MIGRFPVVSYHASLFFLREGQEIFFLIIEHKQVAKLNGSTLQKRMNLLNAEVKLFYHGLVKSLYAQGLGVEQK